MGWWLCMCPFQFHLVYSPLNSCYSPSFARISLFFLDTPAKVCSSCLSIAPISDDNGSFSFVLLFVHISPSWTAADDVDVDVKFGSSEKKDGRIQLIFQWIHKWWFKLLSASTFFLDVVVSLEKFKFICISAFDFHWKIYFTPVEANDR